MVPVSPSICPVCEHPVPPKARACPFCGSDRETGWSDSTYLDGIDLPDDFDYNEVAEREFGIPRQTRKPWFLIWQGWVGAILLVLFIAGMLRWLLVR